MLLFSYNIVKFFAIILIMPAKFASFYLKISDKVTLQDKFKLALANLSVFLNLKRLSL